MTRPECLHYEDGHVNSGYVESKWTVPEIGLFIIKVSNLTEADWDWGLSYCSSFNLFQSAQTFRRQNKDNELYKCSNIKE